MSKILITGGAGYIGSHLCKQLEKNGYVPVVVDRNLKNKLIWISVKNNDKNFVINKRTSVYVFLSLKEITEKNNLLVINFKRLKKFLYNQTNP